MFGYVPRQLGHGMGTKFLKEVLDNCILTTPTAVEKGGKYQAAEETSQIINDFPSFL